MSTFSPKQRLTGRLLGAAFLAGAVLPVAPALAQFALPGAVPPPAPGAGPAPAIRAPAAPRPPRSTGQVFAPSVDGLLDRSLLLNGSEGRLDLVRRDKALAVERLSFTGQKISAAGQICRVDAVPGAEASLREAGRPNGALRYELSVGGCNLSFDVLDGAINVEAAGGTCEFAAQDCRVSPSGLWGPPASSITPAWVKVLEKNRGDADQALRVNFRALMERTKDREQVKLIAREQAGFSSERTTLCRDYQDEARHGFCGTRLTEARAVQLRARLGQAPPLEEKKPVAERRRPTNVGPSSTSGFY